MAIVSNPRHSRAGSRIACGLIAWVCVLGPACSRRSGPSEAPGAGASHPAQAHLSLAARIPDCPPGGAVTLQPSAPNTGHHRVILTWDASKNSPVSEETAVAYCIYRSKKKGAARKNPNCNDCEQVNIIPIETTGCIDDLVQDGAIYYYVVAAINRQGTISAPSNEILVPIPPGKKHSSSEESSYPFCRGAASPKMPRP